MPHTYAANIIHCIFSTKNRTDSIDRLDELCAYMYGIAKGEGLHLIAAGGTQNHLHLLFGLPATVSLADAVKELKGSSSHWMGSEFEWQQGYGAFSVSLSQVEVVKNYIRRQPEHHKERGFEEEFTALLRKCQIDYDPKYVFG